MSTSAPQSLITINQNFANRMISRMDTNITQEIFTTTVDKARLCLNDALGRMEQRKTWIAPAGILATLAVVFPTATFRDFVFSKDTWQAFFIMFTVLDLGWLIYAIGKFRRSLSVEAIIEDLRKGSPVGQTPVAPETQPVSQSPVAPLEQPVNDSSDSPQEEFKESFERGLGQWEYTGEWSVIRKEGKHALVVTDSGAGGIAIPCLDWTNYICEFETKIVNSNTSWIIRAKDLTTYAMLQCHQERINPHFRVNGHWTALDAVSMPTTLPTDVWFGVRIELREFDVKVSFLLEGKERILSMNNLLRPPIAPIEFAAGSIGFRESGRECSHFRNISVKKI